MKYIKMIGLHEILLDVNEIGHDLQVSIYGGDIAHIGAVALAFPFGLAHDPNTITATVMNISVPGHKEDELARSVALKIAKELKRVVVVNCGIHIDKITKEEIAQVNEAVMSLANVVVDSWKS